MKNNPDVEIANLVSKVTNPVEILSSMVVKVSLDINKNIIYYSRAAIPYPKTESNYTANRQIGVYAFRNKPLLEFSKIAQGPIEYIEGIEMLRFLEHGYKIKAVFSKEDSFDIDTHEDLETARNLYKK